MCWWRRFLSDVQNHTQSVGRSPLNTCRLCKQNTRPYGQARRGRRSARLWCFAARQLLCLLRTRTRCRHTLYKSSLLLLLLLYRTIRFSHNRTLPPLSHLPNPASLCFGLEFGRYRNFCSCRTETHAQGTTPFTQATSRPLFGYAGGLNGYIVNCLIHVMRCYPTGNAVLEKVSSLSVPVLSYRHLYKRSNVVHGNGFRWLQAGVAVAGRKHDTSGLGPCVKWIFNESPPLVAVKNYLKCFYSKPKPALVSV